MKIENSFRVIKNGIPIFGPDAKKFNYTAKHFRISETSKSWRWLTWLEMVRVVHNTQLVDSHGGYLKHRAYIRYAHPQVAKITIRNSLVANGFVNWTGLSYSQMKLTIKNIAWIRSWDEENVGDWQYLNFIEMLRVLRNTDKQP